MRVLEVRKLLRLEGDWSVEKSYKHSLAVIPPKLQLGELVEIPVTIRKTLKNRGPKGRRNKIKSQDEEIESKKSDLIPRLLEAGEPWQTLTSNCNPMGEGEGFCLEVNDQDILDASFLK